MGRKHKLILLIVSIFSLLLKTSSWAEEEYYPYPIIFVHGVNSDAYAWDATVAELKQYFYNDDGTCKYFDYGGDYLIALDYENQNNGDIPTIARTALKPKIDEAISRLPNGRKKVIIVAHSIGGLVTRSLLKQYPDYQDKIEKVVFVGTPHLGAPAASAVSILKKLNETSLKDLAKDYSVFYSASLFTGFRFKPTNYSDYVFSRMAAKIMALKASIDLLLKDAKKCPLVPDPDGVAIGQLRVAGDVNYHATLKDFYGLPFIKEEISLCHSGSETFLGQDNLTNPLNYEIVRGVNTDKGRRKAGVMNFFLDSFSNNFTFPEGQSLGDAKDTGDGIVTRASQEGIGEADYTVDAFHTDEPNACKTILQALDDAPVIESVYFPESSSDVFSGGIRIKVKDYLLADIEIAEIIVDGENVDLSSIYGMKDFYDEETGKYKPFVKYGEDFLRERNRFGKGEFEMYIPFGNRIDIKIRNAGGKITECALFIPFGKFQPEACFGYAEGGYRSGCWEPEPGTYFNNLHSLSAVETEAYNIFSNADISICGYYDYYSYVPGGIFYQGVVSGGRIWSSCYHWQSASGTWQVDWDAKIGAILSHKINFKLDIGSKQVKSVKFIGIGQKETSWRASNNYETNKSAVMEDFNILVYRNENLFYSIGTNSFKSGDKIEVDINPEDINLNGENIWEFKPGFGKYNCIIDPPSLSYPPLWSGHIRYRSSSSYYARSAEIRSPFLLVTFEDEAEEE